MVRLLFRHWFENTHDLNVACMKLSLTFPLIFVILSPFYNFLWLFFQICFQFVVFSKPDAHFGFFLPLTELDVFLLSCSTFSFLPISFFLFSCRWHEASHLILFPFPVWLPVFCLFSFVLVYSVFSFTICTNSAFDCIWIHKTTQHSFRITYDC